MMMLDAEACGAEMKRKTFSTTNRTSPTTANVLERRRIRQAMNKNNAASMYADGSTVAMLVFV